MDKVKKLERATREGGITLLSAHRQACQNYNPPEKSHRGEGVILEKRI